MVEVLKQLSPSAKKSVLRALIPEMDTLDEIVQYGDQRIRALCTKRGIDWDTLSEQERESLIDELLHEA